MEELLFTLHAILPMMLLITLGYVLKVVGIFNDKITKSLNKFTFTITIPVLVFYNIYNIDELIIDINLVIFSVSVIFLLFIAGLIFNKLSKISNDKKAVMLQNFFRTNASTMGFQVVLLMGISSHATSNVVALIGISVGLYNTLGVIAFQIYDKTKEKISLLSILLKVITNPIIIGVLLGFTVQLIRVFVGYEWFSQTLTPVYETIRQVASISSPLALITLGSSFYFNAVKKLKKEIIKGVIIRSVIVPILVFSTAILFKDQLGFNSNHFPALIAIMLPSLAVSVAPMADIMHGDTELAGQLIVWTTVFSSVTMFCVIYLLEFMALL